MFQTENLQEKWSPVLAHPDLPKIEDSYKRAVTTVILENQEKAIKEDRNFLREAAPTNSTGADVENWDPILISLVRRSMPNLIAYDICGVQPMTGPTGLIFAMRARFASQDGAEALGDEADSAGKVLYASQDGIKSELNNRNLLKSYLKHPLMTFKIIIAIHYEAFKLWTKGIKFIKKELKIKNNITIEN